jgi:hypothetical protein
LLFEHWASTTEIQLERKEEMKVKKNKKIARNEQGAEFEKKYIEI